MEYFEDVVERFAKSNRDIWTFTKDSHPKLINSLLEWFRDPENIKLRMFYKYSASVSTCLVQYYIPEIDVSVKRNFNSTYTFIKGELV